MALCLLLSLLSLARPRHPGVSDVCFQKVSDANELQLFTAT